MPIDAEAVTRAALDAAVNCLADCLDVISHCLDQLSDEQIWWRPDPAMNSVGNMLIHLEGNLKQWILAGLTERPDTRNRPAEFAVQGGASKTELRENLSQTVQEAAEVLKKITPDEMLVERRIQGFSVTGWDAVFNSLPHFKGHTQEIVCLTRQQKGPAYRFHWTPQSPEEGAPSAG